MSKLSYLVVVMCLIGITITSCLPGCLSVRPFPQEKDAVIGATVDLTMIHESNPSEAGFTATSNSFSNVYQFTPEEEDLTAHPCYAILAEAQIEGDAAATIDGDISVVEVDCRRMLADYTDAKANKNPRCTSTKRC